MYQQINMKLSDGTPKSYAFLSTGTTVYRFKQIFHKDLMKEITKIDTDALDASSEGLDVIGQLAFVMNQQAEKADMTALNQESYLAWADELDSAYIFDHAAEILRVYFGNRAVSSIPKKAAAQLSAK